MNLPASKGSPDLRRILLDSAAEILDRPVTGGDNFFALGGTSLRAIRLLAAVRGRTGIRLSLSDALLASDLDALAASLQRVDNETHAEQRVGRTRAGRPDSIADIPAADDGLTYNQRMRLLRDLRTGAGSREPHHVVSVFRVTGEIDLPALAAAVADLHGRHDALRLNFGHRDGRPFLRTDEAPAEAPTVIWADSEAAALAACQAQAKLLLDLANGANYRVVLARVRAGLAILTLIVDHVVCDGASMSILLDDLTTAYSARIADCEPSWPAPAPSARAWAAEERRQLSDAELERRLDYWRTVLDPLEASSEMRFPGMREPRDLAGLTRGDAAVELSRTQVAPLFERAAAEGMTAFTALAAALAMTAHTMTGRTVIGMVSPLSLRYPGWEDGVSWFSTLVPVRIRLDGRHSSAEVTRAVRLRLAEAVENLVPGPLRVERLQPDRYRDPRWRPWLYLDAEDSGAGFNLDGVHVEHLSGGAVAGLRPGLSLWSSASATGLRTTIQYERQVWRPGHAEAVLDTYCSILSRAGDQWDQMLIDWVDW